MGGFGCCDICFGISCMDVCGHNEMTCWACKDIDYGHGMCKVCGRIFQEGDKL